MGEKKEQEEQKLVQSEAAKLSAIEARIRFARRVDVLEQEFRRRNNIGLHDKLSDTETTEFTVLVKADNTIRTDVAALRQAERSNPDGDVTKSQGTFFHSDAEKAHNAWLTARNENRATVEGAFVPDFVREWYRVEKRVVGDFNHIDNTAVANLTARVREALTGSDDRLRETSVTHYRNAEMAGAGIDLTPVQNEAVEKMVQEAKRLADRIKKSSPEQERRLDEVPAVRDLAVDVQLARLHTKKRFGARERRSSLTALIVEKQMIIRRQQLRVLRDAEEPFEKVDMGAVKSYWFAQLLARRRFDLAWEIAGDSLDLSAPSRLYRLASQVSGTAGNINWRNVMSSKARGGRFIEALVRSMRRRLEEQLPRLSPADGLEAHSVYEKELAKIWRYIVSARFGKKYKMWGDKYACVLLLKILDQVGGFSLQYRDPRTGLNAWGMLKRLYHAEMVAKKGYVPPELTAVKKLLSGGSQLDDLRREVKKIGGAARCVGSRAAKKATKAAGDALSAVVGETKWAIGPLAFPVAKLASQGPELLRSFMEGLLSRVAESKGVELQKAAENLAAWIEFIRVLFQEVEVFSPDMLARFAFITDGVTVEQMVHIADRTVKHARSDRDAAQETAFYLTLNNEYDAALAKAFHVDSLEFVRPKLHVDEWPPYLSRYNAEHNPAVFWNARNTYLLRDDRDTPESHAERFCFFSGVAQWIATCTGKMAVVLPIDRFMTYYQEDQGKRAAERAAADEGSSGADEEEDEKRRPLTQWGQLTRSVAEGRVLLCIIGAHRMLPGAVFNDGGSDSEPLSVADHAHITNYFHKHPVILFGQTDTDDDNWLENVNTDFSSIEDAVQHDHVKRAAMMLLNGMEEACPRLTQQERVLRGGALNE